MPVVVLTRLLLAAETLLIPFWRSIFRILPLRLQTATGTAFDEWNRADARWYLDIAHLGYNLRGPSGYKNVAFFPLFPLLTRAMHDSIALTGRAVLGIPPTSSLEPTYLVAGMLVANLCAAGALAYLYCLIRLDHGRPVARRAVSLLAISPMAFYMFAAYSEGTFLLCAIAFFFALRLERWWQAGLWGLLAAATRPPGAVLLLPFLLAWADAHPIIGRAVRSRARLAWRAVAMRWRTRMEPRFESRVSRAAVAAPLNVSELTEVARHDFQLRSARRRAGDVGATGGPSLRVRPAGSTARGRPWRSDLRQALGNVAPAVAIPLGLICFMVFLYKVFGDPLWFSRAQRAWLRTFAPPWETLWISVAWPLGDVLRKSVTVVDTYALQDLFYEIAGLALTWLACRRLPRIYGAYMWLLWCVFLSSPAMLTDRQTGEPRRDVLMSLPRMLLMMFPIFIYLGRQRRIYPYLAVMFAASMVGYACTFMVGGWVS